VTTAEVAAALLDLGADWGWAGLVVFLRIAAAMALLPAFGEHVLPMRLKLAAALALTAIVAPAVAPVLPPPRSDVAGLVGLMATETVIGLALGASVRVMIWLLQVAGTIAAQATSLAQILGAQGVDPAPAIGQILVVAGLALAAAAGLHVRIAEALILSYGPLPAGTAPDPASLTPWGIGRVAQMFALAFSFGAPFLIASLIYNVALGVINKAMPQLMVAFVGAPAITAGGLLLMLLVAPLILPIWSDALSLRLADPFGAAR
jgi:flagellar biosynthetic protein FliR